MEIGKIENYIKPGFKNKRPVDIHFKVARIFNGASFTSLTDTKS